MLKKLFSGWTLRKAYKKGFHEGSKLWKSFFFLVVIFRILKWIVSRAEPKNVDQYDLAPGEYKVVVTDEKTSSPSSPRSLK